MDRVKKICKILLWPHWAVTALLTVASAVGLAWVFLTGRDAEWVAYPVYVLSAYSLTALCIALAPEIIKWTAAWKMKKAKRTAEDIRKHLRRSLYKSLSVNAVYAVFKIGSGILYQSAWLWSSGLYYLVLSLIRIVLAVYERKAEKKTDPNQRQRAAWSAFQTCGFLLLLLNLTMTGMAFQMIWRESGKSYGEIVTIAIAAFTFYRLTNAIVQVAGSRKKKSPIDGAARNISLTEAMMSLFSLQTALFATYGGDFEDQLVLNCLTGGTVCLLAVLGALGMVLHGRKRKQELLGERINGE